MSEIIENQIERSAPGFKQLILKRSALAPKDLEALNSNLIGGDIGGGRVDAKQLFFRPRVALNPYHLSKDKFWICSSSTPPGPGVHGMSGYWAVYVSNQKFRS
jgi:phytoene dehydrogenase-like protein